MALIWLSLYCVVCVSFSFAHSPFHGLMMLSALSVGLAVKCGACGSSWMFLVIVLVYVGGIMIMFVYFTSLISNAKLATRRPRLVWGSMMLSLVLVTGAPNGVNKLTALIWTSQGLSSGGCMLVAYSVCYLLIALVAVLYITEKPLGPVKQ